MKKLVKILPIILLVVVIMSSFSTVLAAKDPSSLKGTTTNTFDSIGNRIIGMIQAIGSIVAVAILIVLGIKYMMGSAEEKAEYKKTLLPYVIGAILIFAASNLAGIVYNFASTLSAS